MSEEVLFYAGLASGLSVAGFGGLIAYIFNRRISQTVQNAILLREAEIRRRNFRKFVRLCRYRLERTRDDDNATVWKCYTNLAPEIMSEAALVHGDFINASEVADLVRIAGEWTGEQAKNEAATKGRSLRDVLRDSIKAIDDAAKE